MTSIEYAKALESALRRRACRGEIVPTLTGDAKVDAARLIDAVDALDDDDDLDDEDDDFEDDEEEDDGDPPAAIHQPSKLDVWEQELRQRQEVIFP